MHLIHKKYNTYDLTGEYGIGYTSKNEKFYFDLEDYDKIKDYCWYIGKNGYVYSRINKKLISFHRLIMKFPKNMQIDHINRNKNDNKKDNLRIVTNKINSLNKGLQSNNKSGFAGVSWNSSRNKWLAKLYYNHKSHVIGSFNSKTEAIIARLKAEKEFYGDMSPQKHLFKKYNII